MPDRPFVSRLDGRWIALGMLAAFFVVLGTASAIWRVPLFELPPFAWFGPMAPYFADLHGVASWTEQFLANPHVDVLSLRDPWNRPFNYSYWWLYSGYLGLSTQTVMAFGYGFGALFLVAALFVLGPLDLFGGLAAGLFLISYAVMFGFERANVDLLIFALLAVMLAGRRVAPVAALIAGIAAVLKLYPVFAFAALLGPPWKKRFPWIFAGVILFLAGISWHFGDFLAVMRGAPNMRSGVLSFGMTSLGLQIIDYLRRPDLEPTLFVCEAVALILAAGVGAGLRPHIAFNAEKGRDLFAFRIGAGIYLGCFVLGTNHDYRLIFLLFCFPLLLDLMKRRDIARWWARKTLFLTLILVNWLYFAGDDTPFTFTLKQLTSWSLFCCLVALFIATMPRTLQWPRRPEPELTP